MQAFFFLSYEGILHGEVAELILLLAFFWSPMGFFDQRFGLI
jgi:hypothetical protein